MTVWVLTVCEPHPFGEGYMEKTAGVYSSEDRARSAADTILAGDSGDPSVKIDIESHELDETGDMS